MKIVFVGLDGVPFLNRAIDVRLGSFAELFVKCGYKVEIVNRFSSSKNDKEVPYIIYEPFKKRKCGNPLTRLFYYIMALIIEPFHLLKSHSKEKIDILFTSTGHFVDFVVYRLISWLIGAKLVNQYCEARSSFEGGGLYARINGKLVDYVSPKLWDGAVCISHYLSDLSAKANKSLKTTIVYPLCDFVPFDQCEAQVRERYILFCGSIGYRETVDFILESYRKTTLCDSVKLVMVLSGSQQELELFKKENPDVVIETKLPYIELIKRYKEASALLIPLRNNIRDIARFPNKTCEYCASRGVIVTTNVGEMKYVFADKENALVAQNYSTDEYAGELNWLNNHWDDCERIRENCYETGKRHFSIDAYQEPIKTYISKIVTK